MHLMKKHTMRMLALLLVGAGALAGGSGWQTDFGKAAKLAEKAERPILVEFTKDDASKLINKNVFHKGKFKSWARKNVVLLEIDLGKKVSEKLASQYAELRKKHEVTGFPTVLLLDHEGKVLGRPAFREEMTVEAWLESANELVEAAGSAGEWTTDYEASLKLAKRTKKPMLVDFNGSDW